jgi:adenylate cyclase
MAVEIERKFLVAGDAWRAHVQSAEDLQQAYLGGSGPLTIRVRTTSEPGAYLTLKTTTPGRMRSEFEYRIPVEDVPELFANRTGSLIAKRRHIVMHAGKRWEIDVFSGENAGLVIAEIELQSPGEPFERPPWLGAEVTSDPRYYNAALASNPYSSWIPANRCK